ncbi:photosynthetic complex assembly protein PuhC [Nitrobacter sp.]|uniref:photosynthetic complex assembly protein PuhC n=1 Tax=Nitrobacter sp. TaxID=29420 RepID=UPI003F64AAD2
MSGARAERMVPRGAILGAAALIGFSLVVASVSRLTGIGTVRADYAKVVQSVSVRFEDRADGGVAVIAPRSGAVVGIVPAGTDGFVRTVLRSLAFDRQRYGVDAEPAFVIAKWSDGHSTIEDPATGRRVDLGAFGAVNMGAFEHVIAMRGNRP